MGEGEAAAFPLLFFWNGRGLITQSKTIFLLLLLILGYAQTANSIESVSPEKEEVLRFYLNSLANPDPAIQEEALLRLGDLGDHASFPFLNALHEGALHSLIKPDGNFQLVILQSLIERDGEEKSYLIDPLSLETIKEWDELDLDNEEELEYISVQTSTGREILRTTLNRLKLFDSLMTVRRSAATKIGNTGDVSSLIFLERALEEEKDKWVRHAIHEAIDQLNLSDPDPRTRKNAANHLGEIKGLQALPQLKSLLTEDPVEPNEDVRQAIQGAIKRIEDFQGLQSIVGVAFNGLSLGSILFLMGLGLAITFGLMGVINMAHGEMMMIGAYTAFVLQGFFGTFLPASMLDFYFIVALPCAFVATGAVGLFLEKSVIRFLYGRPLETLLATWGISMILQQSARWYFGDLTSVNAPSWMQGGVEVMVGLVLPYNRIFIIFLGILVLSGVYWLLSRTRLGLRIRAVTQNRNMSACLGISTRRVDSWTFALGAGLAGLAGCALSLVGSVDPEMGKTYIVESFMVVVVGGVGKLAGTVVSALSIGMFTKILEPIIGGTGGAIYAKLLILGAIIFFLQRRPSGLFPAKGRAAEL